MGAALSRVIARNRRVRRRGAHSMPSSVRGKRWEFLRPRDGARHATDTRVRSTETSRARGTPARAAVPWRVGAVRSWACGLALINCLIGAVVVCSTPSARHSDRRPVPETSLIHQAPIGTASGSPGSRPSAAAAPPTGSAPPPGDGPSEPSDGQRHDLSVDVQALPPAPDAPDLEAALSDLDKQADRDELIRQQRGPGEQPPVVVDAPPAAQPDGPVADASSAALPNTQPPEATRTATASTAPAPPSPPSGPPPDDKPASGISDQPAISAPDAS
jgi:hypothetical protein